MVATRTKINSRIDLNRIVRLISRLSYMPGWELAIDDGNRRIESETAILLKKVMLDSNDPSKTATSVLRIFIPLDWSNDKIQMHLRFGYRNMALHEVDEWFRIDGVPVTDPHPLPAIEENAEERWYETVIGRGGQCERGWLTPEDLPEV